MKVSDLKNRSWIEKFLTAIQKTDVKIECWTLHIIEEIENSYSDELESEN